MRKGGKCFGTKGIDNERKNEVAVLVCCRCLLKSNLLSGVHTGIIIFTHAMSTYFEMLHEGTKGGLVRGTGL